MRLGGLTAGFVGRFRGGFLGPAGGFGEGCVPADFLFSGPGFLADFLGGCVFGLRDLNISTAKIH